jgi:prepilin-type processing-associated H-X9-DG protein
MYISDVKYGHGGWSSLKLKGKYKMYCQKCGAENPDDVQLCKSCSWVLASNSIVALSPDAKTSGLAITALVLMILSFFTFFLTAIPAIIFGIVALVKIEKSNGRLKGKGLAIAGIAAPAALLPITMLVAIMMPALAQARELARTTVCATNMRAIGTAMMIYTNENDNHYPDASQWCDLLIKHSDLVEKVFKCPSACEGPCNYAMNKNIEKLGTEAPGNMVLLFETNAGWNQSGGPELLSIENHRGRGCNVLFNDGHVKFVKSEDIDNLKWTKE